MITTVIVEFDVKSESVDAFKQLMNEALPDTCAYDGFVNIAVYGNLDKDGNIVLVENWESRAHFEKYLAWRTESGMVDTISKMFAGEYSIRYFETLDI